MNKLEICTVATGLALVTASASLVAAPSQARAATEQATSEGSGDEPQTVLAAAAASVVVVFVAGVVVGYVEAKNDKGGASQAGQASLNSLTLQEFDHVLD